MLETLNKVENNMNLYRQRIADLQKLLDECYNQDKRTQSYHHDDDDFAHDQPKSDKQHVPFTSKYCFPTAIRLAGVRFVNWLCA